MDVDFAMLLEYLTRKKQPTQVSSEPLEKKKCVHEGIDTDEEHVCQKCGLVLGQIYCPDVHWLEHAIKAREYSDMDRLNAVDKTLADFLDKVGWHDSLPLHDVQELLKAMKFRSGFRSINYAIALTCILDGHEELQEKITPFLPRSNAAWARSLAVLDPVPPVFVRSWLKNLLKPTPSRNLTQTQKKRVHDSLPHFTDTELQVMYDLIECYGFDMSRPSRHLNLEALPLELRHVVHKYVQAVKKLKLVK